MIKTEKLKLSLKKLPQPVLFAFCFMVLAGVALFIVQAATIFSRFEPESGSRSGVTTISDSNASGGSYIRFGSDSTAPPVTPPPSTPPPVSSGVCTARDGSGGVPADKFPGAACTGVVAGTSLINQGANSGGFFRITQAGSVWEGYNFTSEVCVAADNVTIRNSRSKVISLANGFGNGGCAHSAHARNLTLQDVEIDANNPGGAAVEGATYGGGITCIRCNLHHAGAGIAGTNYTLRDTYIHSLIGQSSDAHMDGIQVATGDVTIIHSNIVANVDYARTQHTGGGVSCAVCIYSHGGNWGPVDNVLIENSRIEAQAAGQCMTGGYSAEPGKDPSNIRFINVAIYGDCSSAISGWMNNATNVWQNVTYKDQPLGEPGS